MTLTLSDHLGPADLAKDLLLDRVGVLFTPDDLAEVLLSDRVVGLFTPDDLAEVLLADRVVGLFTPDDRAEVLLSDRVVGLFTPDDLAEALLEDPAAEEDDEEEAEELLDPPPVRSDPLSPGSRTCLRPSTNCALSGLSCQKAAHQIVHLQQALDVLVLYHSKPADRSLVLLSWTRRLW